MEKRFNEETQARNVMKKQLHNILSLLGRLVDGNHASQTGVTGTLTSSTLSPSVTTASMLATLPQSSSQPTITGSLMQHVMSFAKSSTYTSVPRISKGM